MRACDYNVYRVEYKTTYTERRSTYGGMDSELTGNHLTEQREYLVVAPDEHFAITAFKRCHSGDSDQFLTIQHVGQLDDLVYLQ